MLVLSESMSIGWTSKLRLTSVCVMLAVCTAETTAKQRSWTDNTGKFSVVAEFVAISNGDVVLKSSTGKTVRVPLERLSEADRAYSQSREHAAQLAVTYRTRSHRRSRRLVLG